MSKGAINFVRHIRNMATAEGRKRIFYALANIIAMALAVAAAAGVKCLWEGLDAGTVNFVAAVIGVILCIAAGVYCFLHGFAAQTALIFIAGAGMFRSESRGANAAAFFIALLTVVGLAVTAVLLVKML